jgi:hypothetical protein
VIYARQASRMLELGAALLVRQSLKLFDGGSLVEIVADHGNVDVLGKTLDEAIAF